MPNADPVVIVSAARTPLGRFQGELASLSAPALGAHVIKAALQRANLSAERVDEALMGCVLPAGQGQAPARQAARGAVAFLPGEFSEFRSSVFHGIGIVPDAL